MQTKVYLVGAGAGDPKLLTLGAKEVIESASIIVYDALVSEHIVSYFPSKAKVIYVGKRAGRHSLTQPEINDLLVRLSREEGGAIVRLKGGDPFVFGRGGEEVEALIQHSIPFEVVPGISAGLSAPAYFGIPVTHRGLSQSVSLITASSREGGIPDLDWEALARLRGTLVFYMGTRYIRSICEQLISHGLSPETPAGIISQGTLPEQKLIQESVQYFASSSEDFSHLAPALLIVGEVVSLSQSFSWYQTPRLAGKRILVTRSEAQASDLAQLLEAEGAEVALLPTIEISGLTPPHLLEELRSSAGGWIVFSSPNSVSYLFEAILALGGDARLLGGYKFGCIGKATRDRLWEYGFRADFVPSAYNAQAFATEFASAHRPETAGAIIIPCSSITSSDLQRGLEARGYACRRIDVYQNQPIDYDKGELSDQLARPIDWATFCSSSAVENLVGLLRQHDLLDRLAKIKTVAIGDSTAQTIRSHGFKVSLQAREATLEAMVNAILQDNQSDM